MTHYDEDYFTWQRELGEFGALVDVGRFEAYVGPDKTVLEFGCGGGYLLKELSAKDKIGIEVNQAALDNARKLGLTVYDSAEPVEDEWADVIVSNHVLEHVERPLDELKALHKKLKSGGKFVLVVPCETPSYKFKPGDVNQHLYSWGPMSLGNLFIRAGFEVISSEPLMHKWPPYFQRVYGIVGKRMFHTLCRVYGRLERSTVQLRIVARKP